eukprot:gene1029-812_t
MPLRNRASKDVGTDDEQPVSQHVLFSGIPEDEEVHHSDDDGSAYHVQTPGRESIESDWRGPYGSMARASQMSTAKTPLLGRGVTFRDGFVTRYTDEEILNLVHMITPQERVQVTFRKASILAYIRHKDREFDTVWSSFIAPFENLCNPAKPTPLLQDINTAFTPGSLCVVVGPPLSGKSTLLKAISGQGDRGLVQRGDILYNTREMENWRLRRLCTYVHQVDVHLPELSVAETLNFACASTNSRFYHNFLSSERAKALGFQVRTSLPMVEFILTKFGLLHVKDTHIGDDLVRGVSGGERKRATVGEMKVTPGIINTEDEISTGLDSAVTIDIMKTNWKISQALHKTLILSLLQPPPDALKLATDMLLLADGKLIYHAPLTQLEKYFKALGFERPPYVNISDFMVDLCTTDRTLYYRGHPCPDAEQLQHEWYSSSLFKEYIQPRLDDNTYTDDMAEDNEFFRHEYGTDWWPMLKLNIKRHWTLVLRAPEILIRRPFQSALIGCIIGHLFFDTDEAIDIIVSLFLIALMWGFSNFEVVDICIKRRQCAYKQLDARFFSFLTYALGEWISEMPGLLVNGAIFVSSFFFMVGLVDNTYGYMYIYFLAIS